MKGGGFACYLSGSQKFSPHCENTETLQKYPASLDNDNTENSDDDVHFRISLYAYRGLFQILN